MIVIKQIKYTGIIFTVLLTLFSMNGCHLAKKAVTAKKVMSEDENMVRKVINAQPEVKFMEMRLTGKAEEDKNKMGFMGTVKLEKDRQVYVMLRSTIGIEIARVYANRDSIWLLSKMLNIKEKFDWKLAGGKIGYPVDFFALQGMLLQSLFTSSGDQLGNLIENLVFKPDADNFRLVSNTNVQQNGNRLSYLNDFIIDRETFIVQGTKIRDVNGQWIADVKYLYNKDNQIKKIEVKGIDSEHSFSVEINVVKKELRDMIEINFDKF